MDKQYSEGVIVQAGYGLIDDEANPVLNIEVQEDSGWFCWLEFKEEVIKEILENISERKTLKSLVGVRVKLLPYPGEGLGKAPIAISRGMLNKWYYKRQYHDKNDRR